MSITQIICVTLVQVDCISCKAIFGMTKTADDNYQNNHKSFNCPYCDNSMFYPGKSDIEREREKTQRALSQLEQQEALTKYQKKRALSYQYQARAEKGAKTRLKNRVKNGICPCCNRTFQNLARHINGQHPEYKE